ncbi:reverse transcriptase [Holotrichia oblita]|uniref:Reverse transcriptase n=1 Tax=Holotrichia oblita TaxID=644536 RepID=A0ACB9T8U0_HOLOL|nr:reverse transcriptase [Holotrichia oblita]
MPYTPEHEKFILEAYFRNGQRNDEGAWIYSAELCIQEFRIQFPDEEFQDLSLSRHIYRVVQRFRETGSVCKGKSSGRKTVLTENKIEEVRTCLDQSPTKPLRQLAQQTVTTNKINDDDDNVSIGSNSTSVIEEINEISNIEEILISDVEKRPALYNHRLPIQSRTKPKRDAL